MFSSIGRILISMGVFWIAFVMLFVIIGVFGLDNFMFYLFMGIGVVILIGGIWLSIKEKKWERESKEKAETLAKNGFPTRARITFVDKNYSVLVNQKPVYSIVECVFDDSFGNQHITRKEDVDSDLVIRAQLKVGDEIDILYMPNDPTVTGLLIKDPYEALRQQAT